MIMTFPEQRNMNVICSFAVRHYITRRNDSWEWEDRNKFSGFPQADRKSDYSDENTPQGVWHMSFTCETITVMKV